MDWADLQAGDFFVEVVMRQDPDTYTGMYNDLVEGLC